MISNANEVVIEESCSLFNSTISNSQVPQLAKSTGCALLVHCARWRRSWHSLWVVGVAGVAMARVSAAELSNALRPAARTSDVSSSSLESSAQAMQRLLFMCVCCEMDSQQMRMDSQQMRYHSAALFGQVLTLMGDSTAAAPADDQAEKLLVMACACMLMAAGSLISHVCTDCFRLTASESVHARGVTCL